jgi:hypothetical protein
MGSAMAFFSMIPIAGKFIGQVFVKSGLKYTPQLFEMSESFYKTLVGKLSGSKKLTEIEVKFLRNIIKFRKQILDGFNNYIKNKSSKLLTDKNLLSKFGKEVQVETAGVLKGLTQGIGYFARYIKPAPFFLPINIVEDFTKPLSLNFRLFGNVVADELTVTVICSLVPLIIPLPIMMLGLFASSLQALIFATLAAAYIGEVIE